MFDIFIEGHKELGSSSTAQLVKKNVAGDTFKDACVNFSKTKESKGWGNFNEDGLSFWGCKLFDNINAAKKHFG